MKGKGDISFLWSFLFAVLCSVLYNFSGWRGGLIAGMLSAIWAIRSAAQIIAEAIKHRRER